MSFCISNRHRLWAAHWYLDDNYTNLCTLFGEDHCNCSVYSALERVSGMTRHAHHMHVSILPSDNKGERRPGRCAHQWQRRRLAVCRSAYPYAGAGRANTVNTELLKRTLLFVRDAPRRYLIIVKRLRVYNSLRRRRMVKYYLPLHFLNGIFSSHIFHNRFRISLPL